MKVRKKICPYCGKEFEVHHGNQKYCSNSCKLRSWHNVKNPVEKPRKCKICGNEFYVKEKQHNKQHCSESCSRKSIQISTKKFHRDNPDAQKRYNQDRKFPDNRLNRFFYRYPEVERKCMSCGEIRVLDLHHIERRNGEERSTTNTTKENILVLCPTCHALIHRIDYTPEQLGIH